MERVSPDGAAPPSPVAAPHLRAGVNSPDASLPFVSAARVRLELIRLVNECGSQKIAACRLKVTPWTVNKVFNGSIPPGQKIANALGFRVPERRGGHRRGF
jgi:hypothetical protein